MEKCCMTLDNRRIEEQTKDKIVEVCAVCKRKHIRFKCEAGHIGVRFQCRL